MATTMRILTHDEAINLVDPDMKTMFLGRYGRSKNKKHRSVLVTGNDTSYHGDNVIAIGTKIRLFGDRCTIFGDKGRISGRSGSIGGNDGMILGNQAQIWGNRARICGHNASIEGEHGRVWGTKPRFTREVCTPFAVSIIDVTTRRESSIR